MPGNGFGLPQAARCSLKSNWTRDKTIGFPKGQPTASQNAHECGQQEAFADVSVIGNAKRTPLGGDCLIVHHFAIIGLCAPRSSKCRSISRATVWDTTSSQSSRLARSTRRLALLTAGPITVKSSRLALHARNLTGHARIESCDCQQFGTIRHHRLRRRLK